MSSYLRNYIERVADVPSYLKRHLALIRDLDEKVTTLQNELEENFRNELRETEARQRTSSHGKRQKHGNTAPAPEHGMAFNMENDITRLMSLADEKVTIAQQIYDFIDKHVQNLDDDLKALGAEIRADKERLGLKEDETTIEPSNFNRLNARPGAPSGAIAAPAAAVADPVWDKRGRRCKRKKDDLDSINGLVPLPAVPLEVTMAEPVYCYCQMPSHGEMVACDNDECPTEWFHYKCVGLSTAPDGQWFCPDCTKAMKEKGKTS